MPAMAALVALLLFAFVHKAEHGSPFAHRDETWAREQAQSGEREQKGG